MGRFHIMTHAYWREGGPEFGNVNVMGVAHGTDRDLVLAHKAAIDEHLDSIGHPGELHECLLGRAQRDQAERNFTVCVSGVV